MSSDEEQYREFLEKGGEAPQEEVPQETVTVVCAANLAGMPQCPRNCRKCFYGGSIVISWTQITAGFIERGEDVVQYFPSKESVLAEYKDTNRLYLTYPLNAAYLANNTLLKKLNALITWLNENYPKWTEDLKEPSPDYFRTCSSAEQKQARL